MIDTPKEDQHTVTIDGKVFDIHPEVSALMISISEERDRLKIELNGSDVCGQTH